MEFLLSEYVLNIPENSAIKSYYIVDDSLKYVAISECGKLHLYSVDVDSVSDMVVTDGRLGEFDSYVLKESMPIYTQSCSMEKVGTKSVRVVRTVTQVYTPSIKKSREPKSVNIINRTSNNKSRLF